MKQRIIRTLAITLFLFVIIAQFLVDKSNVSSYKSVAAFEKTEFVTENISRILKQNCYDCHSNHTDYKWYGSIGVINLFQSHHIEEGKEHVDFSSWETYSAGKRKHKLEEVYEEVEEDHMPILLYKLTHGSLTAEDKEALITWAKSRS